MSITPRSRVNPSQAGNPDRNKNNPNLRHQSGQLSGDDVYVNEPRQDGDTEVWGNWTWESPNAVDAIKKLNSVTDIDDTQYYAVPNFREAHRSNMGAVASASAASVATGGTDNVFTAGWTETVNYINANAFGAGGNLTIADAGWYLYTYSGNIVANTGVITDFQCKTRVNAGTYSILGGAHYTFASAAGVTRVPYFLRNFINLAASDVIRPAFNCTVTGGTVTLTQARLSIEPLYFV